MNEAKSVYFNVFLFFFFESYIDLKHFWLYFKKSSSRGRLTWQKASVLPSDRTSQSDGSSEVSVFVKERLTGFRKGLVPLEPGRFHNELAPKRLHRAWQWDGQSGSEGRDRAALMC